MPILGFPMPILSSLGFPSRLTALPRRLNTLPRRLNTLPRLLPFEHPRNGLVVLEMAMA